MAGTGAFDELARQVEALEARVAELEKHLMGLPTCPVCQAGALTIIATRPDPVLGELGKQQRILRCENWACGHTETWQHTPAPTR